MVSHLRSFALLAGIPGMVATLAGTLACAQAQEAVLHPVSGFREALSDPPPGIRAVGPLPTSLAQIVGMRAGSPANAFDPRAVKLMIGAAASQDQVCINIQSLDGRYTARNLYGSIKSAGATPSLEIPTRFEADLKAYPANDIAVDAYAALNCNERKPSEYFVAILGKGSAFDHIVVQVNAGRTRLKAELRRDNAAIVPEVLCDDLQNRARIGFTAECRLNLPPNVAAGRYQLILRETDPASGNIVEQKRSVTLLQLVAPKS